MRRRLRLHSHAADRIYGPGLFRSQAMLTMQIAACVHHTLRLLALLYTPVGYLAARAGARAASPLTFPEGLE